MARSKRALPSTLLREREGGRPDIPRPVETIKTDEDNARSQICVDELAHEERKITKIPLLMLHWSFRSLFD